MNRKKYDGLLRKNNITNICSNCGKGGHGARTCTDAVTSVGIINIKIVDTDFELSIYNLMRNKFSTSNKYNYKISSKIYSDVNCCISDNYKICDNMYRIDNQSLPYDNGILFYRFKYFKEKILFKMVSRRFSLGFIEFIRGKYNIMDEKNDNNIIRTNDFPRNRYNT